MDEELKKILNFKVVALLIISVLIAYMVGYGIGFTSALNWGVKTTFKIMESHGIDTSSMLNISANILAVGIWQYKENVGGCVFNAPLYNNSRS